MCGLCGQADHVDINVVCCVLGSGIVAITLRGVLELATPMPRETDRWGAPFSLIFNVKGKYGLSIIPLAALKS